MITIRIKRGDFLVVAVGDSMIEAGIKDADYCVIRPDVYVDNGEIALVVVGDGSTIKRFYDDGEEGFRLVPCNPAHHEQHYPPDAELSVAGKFIKVLELNDDVHFDSI